MLIAKAYIFIFLLKKINWSFTNTPEIFFNGRISTLSFIVLQVIYVNVKLESLASFCKIFTRAVIIVIKSNTSVDSMQIIGCLGLL